MNPLVLISYSILIHLQSQVQTHHINRRIVGGHSTEIEKYPFVVSICDKSAEHFNPEVLSVQHNYKTCCTGTILSSIWILSSLRCTRRFKFRSTVWFGRTNMTEVNYKKRRTVVNFINLSEEDDDVLQLLELNEKIPLGSTVSQAKIPTENFQISLLEVLTILGWGFQGKEPDVVTLQEAQIKIISSEECQLKIQGMIMKKNYFCGYMNQRVGTCFGDESSPAVLSDGTVVGVASWNAAIGNGNNNNQTQRHCTGKEQISGYIEISKYIRKIQDITGLRRSSLGFLIPLEEMTAE